MPRKNYRKVPQAILAKVRDLEGDDIVVACALVLRPEDVAKYQHLGLRVENEQLILPAQSVPPASSGRYSAANLYGEYIVRKDLPKVLKTYEFEAPDYGDWARGSHTVSFTKLVYQRDFLRPKELELSATQIAVDPVAGTWTVRFAVEQVFSRTAPTYQSDLFYNLNLLQENVFAADVFLSDAPLANYLATIRVNWEILPPGNVDAVLRTIVQRMHAPTVERQGEIRERLAFLHRLGPQSFIEGTNRFLRYFGAQFANDFVVFENATYGNAIYVMYENWEALSQRSRVDLLGGPRDGFDRIEHREGWQDRVTFLLRRYRARPQR